MASSPLTKAIAAAQSELIVLPADTPDLVEQAHRVRHQVYCLERGYEPSVNGLEIDEFDRHARHVVLAARASGQVIGTARLIRSRPGHRTDSFPMQSVCDPSIFRAFAPDATVEVSRFALCKDRGELSPGAASLARIALVRGLVTISRREGIETWCAAMERTLLRLLRATAIHFEPIGPLVEYHGLRQPAFCHLEPMLERMGAEQPNLWKYVTGGELESQADPRRLLVPA